MAHAEFSPKGLEDSLAHLIEECGEVLSAAGKSQRFGLESVNPLLPEEEREANVVWLMREMADLQSAINRVRKELHDNGYGTPQPSPETLAPPKSHEKLMTGALCQCPNMWTDGQGGYWCCGKRKGLFVFDSNHDTYSDGFTVYKAQGLWTPHSGIHIFMFRNMATGQMVYQDCDHVRSVKLPVAPWTVRK
jgi:NTP pyrophosphatase (non-canonical NTP hydrolase)